MPIAGARPSSCRRWLFDARHAGVNVCYSDTDMYYGALTARSVVAMSLPALLAEHARAASARDGAGLGVYLCQCPIINSGGAAVLPELAEHVVVCVREPPMARHACAWR
jgi:hypothetical protein